MPTLLLLALLALLAADPTPEALAALAHARASVATAAAVEAACWDPAECIAAHALARAAADELASARALANLPEATPDADPFDDMRVWPPFAGTPFPDGAEVEAMIREGESLANSFRGQHGDGPVTRTARRSLGDAGRRAALSSR